MFLGDFIQYIRNEKRYSPHTVTAYEGDLQQFFQFLHPGEGLTTKHPAEITYHDIRNWMVKQMDEGISPRSVNRKLATLRKYFKFLLQRGEVTANPTAKVTAPKVTKSLPVVVEADKMTALLDGRMDDGDAPIFSNDFAGLRDKLIIEMLFGTGMRLAELLGLKDGDIDTREKTIKVLGKRNKQRIIPLNTELSALIERYSEVKKSEIFNNNSLTFIVTNKGAAAYPAFIYLTVQKYLSYISTQDKKSPHVLRHTFATSLLNKGADLNAIKELLGHANLSATQVYTHNSVERLKSIYKQAHPKA